MGDEQEKQGPRPLNYHRPRSRLIAYMSVWQVVAATHFLVCLAILFAAEILDPFGVGATSSYGIYVEVIGLICLVLMFPMSLVLLASPTNDYGGIVFLLFINSFLWGAAVEWITGWVCRWRERRRD